MLQLNLKAIQLEEDLYNIDKSSFDDYDWKPSHELDEHIYASKGSFFILNYYDEDCIKDIPIEQLLNTKHKISNILDIMCMMSEDKEENSNPFFFRGEKLLNFINFTKNDFMDANLEIIDFYPIDDDFVIEFKINGIIYTMEYINPDMHAAFKYSSDKKIKEEAWTHFNDYRYDVLYYLLEN